MLEENSPAIILKRENLSEILHQVSDVNHSKLISQLENHFGQLSFVGFYALMREDTYLSIPDQFIYTIFQKHMESYLDSP